MIRISNSAQLGGQGRRSAPTCRALAVGALLGVLGPLPSGALAAGGREALQSAAAGAATSDSSSAAREAVIPAWRLNAALPPSKSLETLTVARDNEEKRAAGIRVFPSTGMLPNKDQHCPTVRLTKLLVSEPSYLTWLGQMGTWRDEFSSVILSAWGQNFFAQDWHTINFRDLDGRDAFRTEEVAADELQERFSWQAGLPPSNYSAIADLERPWKQAAHLMKIGTFVWDREHVFENDEQAQLHKKEPPMMVALLDCEGELLFVVQLHTSRQYPGAIDVYDRKGTLVAHSLTDMKIARHQFVDTEGHLLATAEAPGLYQNISLKDLPRDAAVGDVFTYVLQFELGGYAGSSRLLEPDFRWILATAVQLRAVLDGRLAEPPVLPEVLPTLYWVTSFAFIIITFAVCLCATNVHPTKLPEVLSARLQDRAERAARQAEAQVAWMQAEAQAPLESLDWRASKTF